MSEDANSAFSCWTAPIGGFVLAMLITFPKNCTGNALNGTQQCSTVLGFPTVVLDQAQGWFLGIIVGGASAGLVEAYRYFTRPSR